MDYISIFYWEFFFITFIFWQTLINLSFLFYLQNINIFFDLWLIVAALKFWNYYSLNYFQLCECGMLQCYILGNVSFYIRSFHVLFVFIIEYYIRLNKIWHQSWTWCSVVITYHRKKRKYSVVGTWLFFKKKVEMI